MLNPSPRHPLRKLSLLLTFSLSIPLFSGISAHADEPPSAPIDPKVFREPKLSFAVEKNADGSATLVSKNLSNQETQRIPLETLRKGTTYYHWTDDARCLNQWPTLGHVSPQEMASRVASGNGLTGGAVYTSLSGTDSITYGHKVFVFTAGRDLLVLPPDKWEDLREAWKEQLPDEDEPGTELGWTRVAAREMNRALAQAGVSGAHAGTTKKDTWLGWFDTAGVSQVRLATYEDIVKSAFPSADLEDLFLFEERFPGRLNPLVAKHPLIKKVIQGIALTEAEKSTLASSMTEIRKDAPYAQMPLYRQVLAATRATTAPPEPAPHAAAE